MVLCSCKTTRFDVLSCRIGAFIIIVFIIIVIIIIIIIIVCKQAEASAFVAWWKEFLLLHGSQPLQLPRTFLNLSEKHKKKWTERVLLESKNG